MMWERHQTNLRWQNMQTAHYRQSSAINAKNIKVVKEIDDIRERMTLERGEVDCNCCPDFGIFRCFSDCFEAMGVIGSATCKRTYEDAKENWVSVAFYATISVVGSIICKKPIVDSKSTSSAVSKVVSNTATSVDEYYDVSGKVRRCASTTAEACKRGVSQADEHFDISHRLDSCVSGAAETCKKSVAQVAGTILPAKLFGGDSSTTNHYTSVQDTYYHNTPAGGVRRSTTPQRSFSSRYSTKTDSSLSDQNKQFSQNSYAIFEEPVPPKLEDFPYTANPPLRGTKQTLKRRTRQRSMRPTRTIQAPTETDSLTSVSYEIDKRIQKLNEMDIDNIKFYNDIYNYAVLIDHLLFLKKHGRFHLLMEKNNETLRTCFKSKPGIYKAIEVADLPEDRKLFANSVIDRVSSASFDEST